MAHKCSVNGILPCKDVRIWPDTTGSTWQGSSRPVPRTEQETGTSTKVWDWKEQGRARAEMKRDGGCGRHSTSLGDSAELVAMA